MSANGKETPVVEIPSKGLYFKGGLTLYLNGEGYELKPITKREKSVMNADMLKVVKKASGRVGEDGDTLLAQIEELHKSGGVEGVEYEASIKNLKSEKAKGIFNLITWRAKNGLDIYFWTSVYPTLTDNEADQIFILIINVQIPEAKIDDLLDLSDGQVMGIIKQIQRVTNFAGTDLKKLDSSQDSKSQKLESGGAESAESNS